MSVITLSLKDHQFSVETGSTPYREFSHVNPTTALEFIALAQHALQTEGLRGTFLHELRNHPFFLGTVCDYSEGGVLFFDKPITEQFEVHWHDRPIPATGFRIHNFDELEGTLEERLQYHHPRPVSYEALENQERNRKAILDVIFGEQGASVIDDLGRNFQKSGCKLHFATKKPDSRIVLPVVVHGVKSYRLDIGDWVSSHAKAYHVRERTYKSLPTLLASASP